METQRRLALTRRALKDLKIPPWRTYLGADPHSFKEAHSLVAKLVHLRATHPTGQEPTLGAGQVPIFNLHGQDPWRGVTWHDEENDIVWLCAASDHDYGLFLSRLAAGQLLPDEEDYADLEAWGRGAPARILRPGVGGQQRTAGSGRVLTGAGVCRLDHRGSRRSRPCRKGGSRRLHG